MAESEYQIRAAAAEAAAQSVNSFAFDLYERVAAQEGNVFFSPYSIHTALHMAFDGADGETAKQMARALRLKDDNAARFPQIELEQDEYGERLPQEVKIANAMWGQSGYAFHEWYLERLKTKHDAQFGEVDFANPVLSAKRISDWIEANTNGRIHEMITPDVIHPLTRLMLTNAIYFRADWGEKFEPENTEVAPFQVSRKEKVDVMMMHQIAHFHAIETDQFQAIAMNYEGFAMTMYVLVPRRLEDLDQLEKTVLRDGPRLWQRYMRTRHVDLHFPKFRMESMLCLGQSLAAMGMSDAFDAKKADFGGISSEPGFALSEVVHKTFVDVDEEGTEAAGATAVMLTGGAGFEEEVPMELRVDRPFLFAITAESHLAQTLLFMGRMVRPTPVG